jgi:hypothetical protein
MKRRVIIMTKSGIKMIDNDGKEQKTTTDKKAYKRNNRK